MSIDVPRRLLERLPELATVLRRFPLAVMAAAALTLYHLLEFHRGPSAGPAAWQVRLQVTGALSAAFLAALLVALAGEARQASAQKKTGLGLVAWAVIGIVFLRSPPIEVDWPLLGAALALALTFAPFLAAPARNNETWQFNHHLWIGFVVAAVATVLFAGGLSAIVETLRYLFALPISYRLHEKIWTLACAFVGPVYWLSVVPRSFAERVPEGAQTEFTSRSVAAIVRYILVPLLLVYGVILHVYAAKIVLDQELPKNRLGWLVLSFAMVLAATALAAFPTREAGGRLVQLFWRVWPWLLVVPVLMLALAIGVRIGTYGLTEERYLVVLAGLWIFLLIVSQGVLAARDLRLVTGSAAVLLGIAAVGPWGMTGWSVRSQMQALTSRLVAAGALVSGRVVPDARAQAALSESDLARAHAVIAYLDSRGRLDMLRPLFEGHARNPFAGRAPRSAPHTRELADAVRVGLGLGQPPTRSHDPAPFVFFVAQLPTSHGIAGGQQLVGPFVLPLYALQQGENTVTTARGDAIRFSLDADSLALTVKAARTVVFDLAPLVAADGSLKSQGTDPQRTAPLEVLSRDGSGRLVITTLNGRREGGTRLKVTHLNFWLVLAD